MIRTIRINEIAKEMYAVLVKHKIPIGSIDATLALVREYADAAELGGDAHDGCSINATGNARSCQEEVRQKTSNNE